MKIEIEMKVVTQSESVRPRLMLSGPVWDTWDAPFCAHGEKLRWSCDLCDEYFSEKPIEKRDPAIVV